MGSSRVKHFVNVLEGLNDIQSLRAFELVKSEMCKEKGFSREDDTHYYYHCVDVAQILINFNVLDSDVISAALLHDIVEDVEEYTIEHIESLFNPRVAAIVALVTKKDKVNYKIPANLVFYLHQIEENMWAALIKTADRLHNFNTLRNCPLEKKIRQAKETKLYFFPFFKRCRNRYPQFAHFFFFAKTVIEPHLWEIEEHYKTIQKYENELKQYRQNDES